MSIGALVLLSTAVGGGTYAYAKAKNASNGQAVTAGVATGAGTAVTAVLVSALLPFLVIAAIVGVPAAGAYLYLNKDKRKALGPGSDY
ncbi:hypothetical protein DB30_04219 [Enhygromyxa salina]|uniref:Uncharacterized protein n=1 Tax=Enhygromyxa salina TaxID=215803 RepID=A0A0C2D0K0_9BACT|nr:hypothetical protein [Enhygromyxa salina]KIG16746.1 hypothetical protein DB30_04219 [Enhygromyxa salina]PRQ04453.1 hypothetical protein ENSA7_51150 [Enhygromyxa salina]